MSVETSSASARDDRLHGIIADYLAATHAGQHPNRPELLKHYPELASELEAFFADHDRLKRWAEPGRVDVRSRPSAPVPGEKIRYFGDYELLGEIARGGMGIVYKARQQSLNRIVALKMIRTGETATPDDIQRFHVEAEIFANLDHPNIVPIYEVGEFQGQQYFSMKLIDGGSLSQHLPRLLEDQRAVSQIVESVARAIDYAHEHGILHRDLKPSNVLLDSKGQPHVSDFGLAKRLHGASSITHSGTILGSPAYMAPEQASGRVKELTTAADVYSLGAILYELLTGRPPFYADTPFDTLRQVTEQQPKRLRALNARVNRDLETICLKCLEKDPKKRYPSAGALADDLNRWFTNEPILARPVSGTEQAWRWCRRHRGAAVLAACLIGLLLFMALRARIAAERAQAVAREQRFQAEMNHRAALQALDESIAQTAKQSDQPAKNERLTKDRLKEAEAYYQALLEKDNPLAELGVAALRLGEIHEQQGRHKEAGAKYQRALELLKKSVQQDPGSIKPRQQLASAFTHLGSLTRIAGMTAEAEAHDRQALAILEKLVAEHPAVPAFRQDLAAVLAEIANLLSSTRRSAEAEATLRRALAIQEKLVTEFPNDKSYRDRLESMSKPKQDSKKGQKK